MKMDVTYNGDDLGWGYYTFKNTTLEKALNYLEESHFFEDGWTDYRISLIREIKKYKFFGKKTYIIEVTRQDKLNLSTYDLVSYPGFTL